MVGKDRVERIGSCIEYLKGIGKIHKQQDIADKVGMDKSNLSRALNGDDRYLTDRFLQRFNVAFDNVFNTSWLLAGEGKMLRQPEGCINQSLSNVRNAIVAAGDNTGSVGGEAPMHGDLSLLRENELLRSQNEFLQRQVENLTEMLKNQMA